MRRLSLAVAVVVVALPLRAQDARQSGVSLNLANAAVARVKASYFGMDYHGGVIEADRLLKQFPKSRELAAWRIANLARSDRPREAQAAARVLLAANRNDPWGWFAQTFVLSYASDRTPAGEVVKTSLEAYRRAPRDPNVIWLRAFALSNNNASPHALALIDSANTRGVITQELRTLRATALFNVASPGRTPDAALVDSAFRLYARARAADSTDATAYTFAASRLMNSGRNAEAYALAKRGAEISRLSLAAHENYWRAIDGLKDRSQAERDAEALADVDVLLRERGTEPAVLAAAVRQYRTRRQTERANALQDRLLSEHPRSAAAEFAIVDRYRELRRQLNDTTIRDSTLGPRYREALWSFVNQPTHVRDVLIGDAYRELFRLSDSTTHADTLLRIVRGMAKYEGINPHITHADGAIRLAERGRDFAAAEQIARDGLKAGKARIDEQKEIYETVGDYARAVDWMSAFMYDALGVVYMRQGRLNDAEKQLRHALELDPKSLKVYHHLGQLAERRGQLVEAEQSYVKGSLLSTMAANPNRTSLERVYKATRGSADGYSAFLSGLAETDRANRRAEIAKSRAAEPVALKPFSLKTVDGKIVSLDSLRGKTAVINNWGMWCGPCVAEMPEFQKLATQYAADSGVRILTIDNDPNTDELKAWLEKKGYTFTTLIDDGYLRRSNISAYPTTWFLDATGRVVFTKTGWSEKLIEEFGWRIDMIRNPSVVP
jgi:thiol-disulfide isomerase/thioredoxin